MPAASIKLKKYNVYLEFGNCLIIINPVHLIAVFIVCNCLCYSCISFTTVVFPKLKNIMQENLVLTDTFIVHVNWLPLTCFNSGRNCALNIPVYNYFKR